jgi:hypothetical protein
MIEFILILNNSVDATLRTNGVRYLHALFRHNVAIAASRDTAKTQRVKFDTASAKGKSAADLAALLNSSISLVASLLDAESALARNSCHALLEGRVAADV